MALRHLSVLSGAVVLAFTVAPGTARATVTWTSTFEKGDVSEWTPGINAVGPDKTRKNIEVLGEKVYAGKFAGKIVIHPDDKFSADQVRVDIQHQSTLTDEGENMWLSGHYLLPADAGGREEFGFFESNVSFSNVMDFWFDAKAGGGTTINYGTGFLGDKKLWTADFTTGVWHQVALHVLWSTDAQKGTVDVWFDGQQVVTAAHAKTKADGNSLFFQTGLHRRNLYNVTTTDTLYLDEFIEGDSMADIKIAAPMPEMGGGGTGAGGMAGAAGAAGGSTAGAAGSNSPLGGGGAGGAGGAPSQSGMGAFFAVGDGSATMPMPIGGTSTAAPSSNSNDSSGCSLSSHDKSRNSSLALLALLALAALTRRFRP